MHGACCTLLMLHHCNRTPSSSTSKPVGSHSILTPRASLWPAQVAMVPAMYLHCIDINRKVMARLFQSRCCRPVVFIAWL